MVTVISAIARVSVELWHNFIAFRVPQQECLLFTENREGGRAEKELGEFSFPGSVHRIFPHKCLGDFRTGMRSGMHICKYINLETIVPILKSGFGGKRL